jgi:hypothetical protein
MKSFSLFLNAELSIQERDATEAARELRECGVDDAYYEDHASWCRREIYKLQFDRE